MAFADYGAINGTVNAVGGALTLGLRSGAALVFLLVLPLTIPALIFGTGPMKVSSEIVDEDKKPNTNLVVRSRDPDKLRAAMDAVQAMLTTIKSTR